MYNADVKGRFLWDMERKTGKQYRLRGTYSLIFGKTESLEERCGCDLAELPYSELGDFDEMWRQPPARYYPHKRVKSGLLQYLEWYKAAFPQADVTGATKWVVDSLEHYKNGIVANPTHLQLELDKIFGSEDDPTIHAIYRSFLWVAFSGVWSQCEAVEELTANDIDFTNFKFTVDGRDYPIYQQATKSLAVAAYRTELLYKHPDYTTPIMRSRVEGDSIFRGIKGEGGARSIANKISKIIASRSKELTNVKQLTYSSVSHSGTFYRQYELEMAGMDVDFSHIVKPIDHGEEMPREMYISRTNVLNNDLQDEYYLWKYLLFKDKV